MSEVDCYCKAHKCYHYGNRIPKQYFLYRLAILIPITTDSIPATARHPPQISILIIQYTTPAMTRLDNPLLICAASFPVCIIQPAMVCVNVAIASKNTTQSEINILTVSSENSSRHRIPYQKNIKLHNTTVLLYIA